MADNTGRRKCPAWLKDRISREQGGQCAYCGLPIGAIICRLDRSPVTLQEVFDHFVPLAYAQSNSENNWVMACQVCNAIKGDHVYPSMTSAQLAIRTRRIELGYESPTEYWLRIDLGFDAPEPDPEPEPDDWKAREYLAAWHWSHERPPVPQPHHEPGCRCRFCI